MSEVTRAREELDQNGFCVLPNVLIGNELERARRALERAMQETERRGDSLYNPLLDPNKCNLRVAHLPDFDSMFIEMLKNPRVLAVVRDVLGQGAIVSNFSANIALPGSGSMQLHSDQALVVPPPWTQIWAMNMIWCLDDVHEANGATRYLPGSHRYQVMEDLPPESEWSLRAFAASAGSVIAMDGRLWHTSGPNVTKSERRALLFAYYTRGFLRQQVNWDGVLSARTQAGLDDEARTLLGMATRANPYANTYGAEMVFLKQ